MARRSVIRASDIERDAVAERLRHAAAEGRILASELEHRLALALRARTVGELDELVEDLPSRRSGGRAPARPSAVRVVAYGAAAVAVLAVLAMAALVIAGLFMAWAVWVVIAWWAFGSRRRRGRGRGAYARPPLRTARRGLL